MAYTLAYMSCSLCAKMTTCCPCAGFHRGLEQIRISYTSRISAVGQEQPVATEAYVTASG